MPTTIDKVKDQLKAAGVDKMVLWSAGRDLFPLVQALGEGTWLLATTDEVAQGVWWQYAARQVQAVALFR